MPIVKKIKKHHIENLEKVKKAVKKNKTECNQKKLKKELQKLFGDIHGEITKQELNTYLTKVFSCSLDKNDIDAGLVPTPFTLAKITSDRAFQVSDFEEDKTLTVYQFEHFFKTIVFPLNKQKGGGIGKMFNKFVDTITVKNVDEQCIIDSSKKMANQRVWKNISDFQAAVLNDAYACSQNKGYTFWKNIGKIFLKVLLFMVLTASAFGSKEKYRSKKKSGKNAQTEKAIQLISTAGAGATALSLLYDEFHVAYKVDRDLDVESIKEWNESNPIDRTVPKKWWKDWGYTFLRRYIYSVLKQNTRGSFAGRMAVEAGDMGAIIMKDTITTPSEYKRESHRYKKLRGSLK